MSAEVIERIREIDEEILLADGFEDALIGVVTIFNKTVALYDYGACIEILMRDGISHEEAVEHLEFNVIGAYVGEYTPGFATILKEGH